MNEYDIVELKQAYRVFGLPHVATANDVKREYRALLRRWHPDLYVSGTQNHEDATGMAKTINDAYSKIRHAPLRYYVEKSAQPQSTMGTDLRPSAASSDPSDNDGPRLDRIEFWVRFVFGAVFGVLVSLNLALQFTETSLRSFVVATVVVTLGCGFASARFGDRFWRSVLARLLIWS